MSDIFESSLPEEEYQKEINGLKYDLSRAYDLILEQIKNIAEEIVDDTEWVNDSQ